MRGNLNQRGFDMSTVFEKASIGTMQLQNRIIRSATHEGYCCEDGGPMVDKLVSLYRRLGEGGAGAIITGYCGVSRSGRAIQNMRMFDDDRFIEEYAGINGSLKQYGVPVINQICHGGGFSSPDAVEGEVMAPSKVRYMTYNVVPREMSEEDIYRVKDDFVAAIVRSKNAGFDGVQVHCAHGYLLCEFLSPAANRRRDQWGGSTENRFRLIDLILEEARKKVGNYPILAKISAYDGDRGGMRIDESVKVAKLLQGAGCDGIEVSCGGINDGFAAVRGTKVPVEAAFALFPAFRDMPALKKAALKLLAPLLFKKHTPLHLYNVDAAQRIKSAVDIPVIVVGGFRNIDAITDVINNEKADFVSMSRPFIIEPGIVNAFRDGSKKESACIDCAYCLMGVSDNYLRCYKGRIPGEKNSL